MVSHVSLMAQWESWTLALALLVGMYQCRVETVCGSLRGVWVGVMAEKPAKPELPPRRPLLGVFAGDSACKGLSLGRGCEDLGQRWTLLRLAGAR